MTPTAVGVTGLIVFLVLLAARIPVGVAMIAVAVGGYAVVTSPEAALSRLGADGFREAGSYNLSVIPLFVLMGMLFANAGLGHDVYRAINVFVYRLRGGLALATLGASAAFGSVSGSAVASTTTMSSVALPEMRRHHYDDGLSTGTIAVGGTLGILIPPSSVLVLYGVITEEPIGAVLIAGIIPGIMTTALLMVTAYILVRRKPSLAPKVSEGPEVSKLEALRSAWAVPVGFGVSMGGLYFGFFTPTEAAAVGAFLALAYGLCARRLDLAGVTAAVSQSVRISAMIFLLVIGGKLFGYFLTVTGIPRELGTWIAQSGMAPFWILASIFVVYFVLGALMDEIAILVIMTPITYPIVIGMGYSGIWFGVLSIMMLLTGLLTPPVGLISFVVSGVTKVPLGTVFRGVTPFWMTLIVAIFLVMVFPSIATSLPDLMK